MAAWCLPKSLSNAFLDAIKTGKFTPEGLMAMTSEERRAAFSEILGPENAREVNAQFEAKMLLNDQKRGLVNWAKKIGGLTEPARRDILNTINKLDRVLNPDEERAFLNDLAAKKLGVSVTVDEAKAIFGLAQKAEQLRAEITAAGNGDYRSGWTVENGTAYGRAQLDLLDKINSLKPNGTTIRDALINILNLPKTALTSILHWSAPFVQGWGMISTRQWWEGLGKMFQYFASEENYRGLEGYIVSHPDYEIAKAGKLGLTKLGDKLSTREESIQSSLIEDGSRWLTKKSGVADLISGAPQPIRAILGGDGNLIKAWSRSFVGFLNYVRFNRYVDLLNAARLGGEDIRPGSKVANDLAKVVNDFSGRGELGEGDKYSSIGPVLNAVFFSPRKITATIEMFNPVNYARLSPVARKAAIRQLSGSLVATGAVLTLAKVMGAQVNMDPRSSDFAKVNIGGEKLDMTGGNASYLRFLARIFTGQEITSTGKLISGGSTRAEVATNFIIGKLAPIPSVIVSALYGHDPSGRPFNIQEAAANELIPIVIHSFMDFALNNPNDTAAIIPAMSALLGVGLESPLPPMSKTGLDVWGDHLPPFGTPKSWRDDPVTKAYEETGKTPGFPPQKIRGVALTSDQYHDYVQLSGRLAHMRLEEVVSSPGWEGVPKAAKAAIMQEIVSKSRDIVATSIMMQSQGTPHDIVKQAQDAKLAMWQDAQPTSAQNAPSPP